jgi:glycosyltransferase involved in cell wall biosynthesis
VRIAFLTHEPFYPPSGGGSAEAVYLVQEFVARCHEVHLFCPGVTDPSSIEKEFGIRLHPFTRWTMGRYTALRNLKYLGYPFVLQRMVESVAHFNRFDLIFSQHAISAVAAGRLKRSLGVPVVMNFLDYLTAFMETWPSYLAPRPALQTLKRFELNLPRRFGADAILTVSDTLADLFASTGYPRQKILPIYYGFDAELFRFDPADLAARAASPATVVMHGSLDHHHLRDIGLRAMERVVKTRPDVTFRLIGHPTAALRAFQKRATRTLPARALVTTGFVPYSEIAQHLRIAHAGIVPYEESSGTHCAFVAKTVEYLALGLPVVSTPLRSVQSYFQGEPMVRFSEFNGDSFGGEILRWLEGRPEEYRAQAIAASQRVCAELDWKTIRRRAVDFVEQICKKH